MYSEMDFVLKKIIIDINNQIGSADDIQDDTSIIADLGFHSSLAVRLLMEIEKTLDIMFEEEELNAKLFIRYGNLRDCVVKKFGIKE